MMWKFFFVNFLSALSVPFESSYAQQIGISYRLPNNTSPESYFVNLKFDDFNDSHTDFTGSVFIVIRVHADDTSVITLHSAVLITSVNLTKFVNGSEVGVAQSYDVDAVRQFLLIQTLEETIKRGSVLGLRIEFSGKIISSEESEDGIFIGRYENFDNRMR